MLQALDSIPDLKIIAAIHSQNSEVRTLPCRACYRESGKKVKKSHLGTWLAKQILVHSTAHIMGLQIFTEFRFLLDTWPYNSVFT